MRLHAEFFRLVHARLDAFEPLFAQIDRIQPDPGVHEKSAQAHLFENMDLPDQFRFIQFRVPGPERRPAEFRTRSTKIFHQLFHLIVLFCLRIIRNRYFPLIYTEIQKKP